MVLIPETIEELEIARKESRRRREQKEKEEAQLREETRQKMLVFCRSSRHKQLLAQGDQNELWRHIFKHLRGRFPRDPRRWRQNIVYFLHKLNSRLQPNKKRALLLTRPPKGATDPYWDKLFSDRKAMSAYRWAIKQLEAENKELVAEKSSSHFVKTA